MRILASILLALFALAAAPLSAAETLKVLIVDGQNNHQWQKTTPLLKQALESSGRFTVEVATSPPKGGDMSTFVPEFAKYQVVVSNYNGDLWCEEAQTKLEEFLEAGGGLVVVHAANNAFSGWQEYNAMIGLGWRGNSFGTRVTLNDEGTLVVTPKGEGPGAGHGPQHEYEVVIRNAEHPITKGLPRAWLHSKDELYHGQRGPAENMTILATAFSDSGKGGTGAHEPLLWTIPYGKGRVFTTLLGHADYSQECVGFITALQRGSEWAATGEVTLTAVPEDFPTQDATSTREPK